MIDREGHSDEYDSTSDLFLGGLLVSMLLGFMLHLVWRGISWPVRAWRARK